MPVSYTHLFAAKGEILKLWGLIKYQKELPEIEACLQRMDLSKIIIDPKHRRRNKIGLNEDSFYYLCFACSFKAYSCLLYTSRCV